MENKMNIKYLIAFLCFIITTQVLAQDDHCQVIQNAAHTLNEHLIKLKEGGLVNVIENIEPIKTHIKSTLLNRNPDHYIEDSGHHLGNILTGRILAFMWDGTCKISYDPNFVDNPYCKKLYDLGNQAYSHYVSGSVGWQNEIEQFWQTLFNDHPELFYYFAQDIIEGFITEITNLLPSKAMQSRASFCPHTCISFTTLKNPYSNC